MAGYNFGNSRASSTLPGETRIETGLIINVNPANKTVDWAAQYTGRLVVGLQVSSPYLHFYNGEGQTMMPDLGAICSVCWPSDGEAPFVMSFLMPPEPMITVDSGSPQVANQPTAGGYNGGRPLLNPGDMYLQGRDDNFLILRRGGVLQVGASDVCQRLFIPLNNLVRDVCENWELNTIGGSLTWKASMADTGPNNEHQDVQLDLIAREGAQDKLASIRVSVGNVKQSDSQLEVVVAKEGIDPVTGEVVASSPAYVMRVFDTGKGYTKYDSDLTEETGGTQKTTIKQNRILEVAADYSATVKGSHSTTISGAHKITGEKGSVETWAGGKTIDAVCRFGGANASHPGVLGDNLLTWLLMLVSTLLNAGITVAPPTPAMLSKKVLLNE